MMKIATHNSVTGEKGAWLSKLLTPFARCQTKTLLQQYQAGCRFIDLRIVSYKGKYYGAHGKWRTQKDIATVLKPLHDEISKTKAKFYIMTTYEGKLNEDSKKDFLEFLSCLKALYPSFVWGSVYAKYEDNNLTVDWTCIKQGAFTPKTKQGFLPLDGRHWQTYMPIPWLWKKIYYNKPKFNEDIYLFVDFL